MACALLPVLLGWSGVAVAAGRPACPQDGAIYRPNPEDWNKRLRYRLRTEYDPVDIDPVGLAQRWIFSITNASSGRLEAMLELRESCPAGGLCELTKSGAGPIDVSSTVI